MEKSVVALIPCDSYEEEKVYAAVCAGVGALGGIEKFVGKEEKVLLKPNLLAKAPAHKAITTHPAVFGAVARLMRENGYAHVTYGDSPGSPTAAPEKAAEVCGIKQAAEKWGAVHGDFSGGSSVPFPAGKACRSFYLCRAVQEADAIISVCKMKTHALARITGAVKNLYGCIWSANKAAGHARFPSAEAFADMLADLLACVKPRLHIMDGITAMEGNGPTSGTPTQMNVLLFSADPVALDSVFAALVDLKPALVPTCVSADRCGLGTMDENHITVRTPEGDISVSQAAERYGNKDFNVFRGELKKGLISKVIPLLPALQDRPAVDKHKCVACGICEEACPVPGKAVHSGNGQKAKYDYRKCIRCYCCQEMCPAKAISVRRSLYNRLFDRK